MGEGVRDADRSTPRDNSMAILIRVEGGGHVASLFCFKFLGLIGSLELTELTQPTQ